MINAVVRPDVSRLRQMARQIPLRAVFSGLVMIPFSLHVMGCSTTPTVVAVDPAAQPRPTAEEETYGIKIEGLRLSAAGSMLDFRYRVLDAQKAAPILDGKFRPYLIDEARGARLGVPDTPVLGRIRQTSRNNKILTDRTYFIMFGNPGKAVQSGDKVSLLLGQVKITELVVQ